MKIAQGGRVAALAATFIFGLAQPLKSAASTCGVPGVPRCPISSGSTSPTYGSAGKPPSNNGITAIAIVGGGVAMLTGAIALLHGHHNQEHIGDDNLLTNGPQLDLTQQQGSLTVHGFVQAGWPLVIDFKPKPGTQTIASISVPHHDPVFITLDSDSDGSRRVLNNVRIPKLGATGIRAGVIIVYSVMPAPAHDNEDEIAGAVAYAPLDIYGIGAGPSAVGSVAIEELSFAQRHRTPGAGFADYGFLAEAAFQNVVAEVLRFSAVGRTINVASIRQLQRGPGVTGPSSAGQWDGLDAQKQKQRGAMRLQVRGWMSSSIDKSWVGAVSPQAIVIK